MVLASLVMTVAMPTVTVAMARNQSSAQRRGPVQSRAQARTNSNKQKTKKSLWNRIKDNWEYIALGGCALVGIAAILWNLNHKGLGTNPNPAPRPAAIWVDDKIYGVCPICAAGNIALGHPSCCPNQICRTCWDTPVKTGETEFVDDTIGLRIVDESKVREKHSCPFCRTEIK